MDIDCVCCSGSFEVVVFLPGQATGTELYSKLKKGGFPDFQQLAEAIAAYLESSAGSDPSIFFTSASLHHSNCFPASLQLAIPATSSVSKLTYHVTCHPTFYMDRGREVMQPPLPTGCESLQVSPSTPSTRHTIASSSHPNFAARRRTPCS